MIKIFLSVRNRLAITKKCIEALKRHSKIPHQIYVYDNQTNYLIDEHFKYFCELYKNNEITQICFTTTESTFNAFSKASTCNFFGKQHDSDPKKDTYEFLLILDNDIIVKPQWDIKLNAAWEYVKKNNLSDVKVIGQLPGGIKNLSTIPHNFGTMTARIGMLGGSGFWSVRPNFFIDVGFLNLKNLIGQNKKHDQLYWRVMHTKNNGKPYIMGLKENLAIHCGLEAGSICNNLTRNRPNKEQSILFVDSEKKIDSMTFDDFYNKIIKDEKLIKDW